ncbi:hypothetical protein [Polyangium sp. 15x6]|uniref:hypothetical protein n=1 Tax=Polyangium sp. 15x6 TaxID=3042687 RepID=UPI00249C92DF|nr:hypothetical protein [Polyangium sp. 15x6]
MKKTLCLASALFTAALFANSASANYYNCSCGGTFVACVSDYGVPIDQNMCTNCHQIDGTRVGNNCFCYSQCS